MKSFDSIIIGSGQAGTPLVFSLAAKGKKVAFIEKKEVGGTCLNVGCTPTKTYVASARRMWDIQHAKDMGIDFNGSFKANIQAVKNRKDELIGKSITGIRKGLTEDENITFIEGEAKFISDYEIEVHGEKMAAPQIFINVGGRAFVPDEYNGMNVLTNGNILDLTELPEHLVIIGGSYIGLEFGQMFRRFGSRVTIIERGPNIISREDEEVSKAIQEFMEADGVEFIFNAQKIIPEFKSGSYTITVNDSQKISGTHLLLAIGRTPNTDLLQLQNTTILSDKRGFITVNDYCQTNVEGIFALGDCNGKGAFTHTAYNDYQVVENFLFGDGSRKISDRIMTYGLFVDPPLGRAGMTKKDALAKGIKLLEGKREMSRIARAKEKGETYGFMQLLVNADSNKIIGACVLGTGGDEIITGILNIMSADMDYTLIRDTMVLHPTISELIPTTLENLKEVN
jgi:pyruvate/2-oxoglutarate dehydrogenase complex dihydrolipoamide dehydrogenase (E3) component